MAAHTLACVSHRECPAEQKSSIGLVQAGQVGRGRAHLQNQWEEALGQDVLLLLEGRFSFRTPQQDRK